MSFRGRLRVFFAIIVIVPMVAIGVALLSITASSERGKTDAGLATALTVAFSAYDEGRAAARDELRGVAGDSRADRCPGRGGPPTRRPGACVRSSRAIRRSWPPRSHQPAVAAIRAGSAARRGARERRSCTARSGGRLGTLAVSVTDARVLARTVRDRTRARRCSCCATAARWPPRSRLCARRRPGSGDFEAGGRRVPRPARACSRPRRPRGARRLRRRLGAERRDLAKPAAGGRASCSPSCCSRWPARCSCRARCRSRSASSSRRRGGWPRGRFDAAGAHPGPRRVRAARAASSTACPSSSRRKIEEVERKRRELENDDPPRRRGVRAAGSTARASSSWPSEPRSTPARPTPAARCPLDRARCSSAVQRGHRRSPTSSRRSRRPSGSRRRGAEHGRPAMRRRTASERDGVHALAIPLHARLGTSGDRAARRA